MRSLLTLLLLFFGLSVYAQTWVQLADIPNGRHHPVTFSLNGKGYSVTGTRSTVNTTKDFYEYDPVTNSWRTLPQFPGTARSFAIGTTYKGKAYMGFGASNSQYLNDLWEYDPADSSWTQLASCPCTGRRHPAFIAANNSIYVGFGDGFTGNLNDWWMYDMILDTWNNIPDVPGPARHHPYQFYADGYIYAGFGHAGQTIFKDWYRLDTTFNTWTAMNTFPGEARVAGTQFGHDDLGYVLSGDGDNHSWMPTGEFWRYYPSADTWQQLPAHPGTSRWAPGSFVIDDESYFFGGLNRSTQQFPTDMYKIDISQNSIGLTEEQLADIRLFPNPASEYVTIETGELKMNRVHVYNTIGEQILEIKSPAGNIDISELSPGLFVIIIDTEQGTITKKLVKEE